MPLWESGTKKEKRKKKKDMLIERSPYNVITKTKEILQTFQQSYFGLSTLQFNFHLLEKYILPNKKTKTVLQKLCSPAQSFHQN